MKETRIKETFGYKKRFHSSDFMQVKLSTLIGQLIKETMDKRNPFLTPNEFGLSEFNCIFYYPRNQWNIIFRSLSDQTQSNSNKTSEKLQNLIRNGFYMTAKSNPDETM